MDAASILEGLAEGRIAFREAAGLTGQELEQLAGMARIAFEQRKFDRALIIFTALEALEPDRPEHSLRRAHAETRCGRKPEALASVRRYLAADLPAEPEHVSDALQLMAYLVSGEHPERATALRAIAERHRKRSER